MENTSRTDSEIPPSAGAALAVHNQADDFGGAKVSSPLRSREFPGLVGREDAPLALYLVKAGTHLGIPALFYLTKLVIWIIIKQSTLQFFVPNFTQEKIGGNDDNRSAT